MEASFVSETGPQVSTPYFEVKDKLELENLTRDGLAWGWAWGPFSSSAGPHASEHDGATGSSPGMADS